MEFKKVAFTLAVLLFCTVAAMGQNVNVYDCYEFNNSFVGGAAVINISSNIAFDFGGIITSMVMGAGNKTINGNNGYILDGNGYDFGMYIGSSGGGVLGTNRSLDINNISIKNMGSSGGAVRLGLSGSGRSSINLSLYNVDFDNNNRAINTYNSNANGSIVINSSGTSTFSNNSSYGDGGAIYAVGANIPGSIIPGFPGGGVNTSVNFTNSDVTFINNTAANGGAIFTSTANLTFSNSNVEFLSNAAKSYGGAIYITGSSATLNFTNSNVNFVNNTAVSGGALYAGEIKRIISIEPGSSWYTSNEEIHERKITIEIMPAAQLSFSGSAVTAVGNTAASGNGGFLYLNGQSVIFDRDVMLISNTAREGGAIYAAGSSTRTTTTTTTTTTTYNGLWYVTEIITTIEIIPSVNLSFLGPSTTISYNKSTDGNGVIHLGGASTINFSNTYLTAIGNEANKGGFLYLDNKYVEFGGSVELISNTARQGGAIYLYNSWLSFLGSSTTISYNKSTDGNGVIHLGGNSTINFSNTYLTAIGNEANKGGFLYLNNQSISFNRNVELISNTARQGGAIYIDSENESFEEHSIGFLCSSTTISYNKSTDGNGVIHLGGYSTVNFSNTYLTAIGNEANNGGFLYLVDKENTFTKGVNLSYNSARGSGGGMYVKNTRLSFYESAEFKNNIAGDGGGVFFTESSKVLFDKDVLFSGNKTNGMMNLSYGGAIYSYKSTYTFNGSQYFENNATAYAKGGAIYADASIFTFGTNASVTSFTNNTITGNSSFGGAAIYALNSTLNFNSYISSFTGNKTIGETSVSGGAIYVSGSYMNFQGETYFDGNVATSMGGAIAFVGGNLVFGKDVSFQKNQAVDGGAIYIGGSVSNTLSFNGNVLLGGTNGYGNKASEFSLRGGGAIFIGTNGGTHTLNFASDKNVKFENNSAGNGGAISMYSNAVNTLHFNNGVGFYSNTASLNGGAVNSYVYGAGNLGTYNFLKTGVFENNSAGDSGGAIYALTQSVFNIGAYDFVGNSSSGTNVSGGGAIYSDGSTFVFGASVQADTVNNFTGNSANGVGGAIFQNRSDSTFYNQGIFYDNSAGLSGGAVYASSGTMTFASSVLFESNNASGDFITSGGGAIYTFAQTLKLLGGSEFKNNKAQGVTNGSGGAVYASGSYLVFDGGVLFSQNLSETEGGAVYLTGKGKIEFTDAQFLSNSAGTNGGAIYLKGSSASEIAEIYFNKTTLFNANTANGSANAIHFAGNAYVEFNLQNQTANINDSITASAANNTLTACGGGTFNMNDNILGYQSLNLNLDAVTFNFAAGAMSLNDMSLSNSVLNMQDALAIAQTVSISGDLTLDSQSELRLDVFAGGDCDVINVGGTASLDGAINVKPGVGTYDNEWFTLINAYGGFNGTDFSSAVFQDTFVHRTDPCDLKYNFEFDASQNRYMLVVNGIRQSYFSQVDGMGRNQKNVAAMYDNLSANASRPLANVINSINDMPDISQLDALLETAPYFIANALNYSLHNRSKRDLFSHIEKSDKTNNVWAYADGGGSLVFQSDINSPGDFETADYGAVFGADRKLSPNFMLGFYGKYNIANISQGKSEGNITSYGLGTYALANKNAWQFKAALGYEGQSYDITRSIVMSDTSVRSAKTEFNSYLLEADIEASYDMPVSKVFSLSPFAGINGSWAHYGDFDETGADVLSLEIEGSNSFVTNARLGISANMKVSSKLNLRLSAEYDRLFSGYQPELNVKLNGETEVFETVGSETGQDVMGLNLYASYNINENLKAYASGAMKTAENLSSFGGTLGVKYSFKGR